MFLNTKPDVFKVIKGDSDHLSAVLKPNIYKVEIVRTPFDTETILTKHHVLENMRMLDTGKFKVITDGVLEFLDPAMHDARAVMGNLHKYSIMMYGTQGCGKTAHAILLADKLVKERDAIGLIVSNANQLDLNDLITTVREKDPTKLIILILDEFEKSLNYGNVPVPLLSFLDGPESKDNILIIATCNNITALPDLLLDRPGRFECIYQLEDKSDEVLKATIEFLIPHDYRDRLDVNAIAATLKAADKWTVDYIRIVVRNSIAEVINYDKTGVFKQYPVGFSSVSSGAIADEEEPECLNTGISETMTKCDNCQFLDECDETQEFDIF